MSLIEQGQAILTKLCAFDFAGLDAVMADDLVMELPYAPEPIPQKLEGKQAALGVLGALEQMFDVFSLNVHDAYEAPGENTAILEATALGVRSEGGTYQNRYVFVFTFEDGKLKRWLEFFNPNLMG